QLESGRVAPLCVVARIPNGESDGSSANAPIMQAASAANAVANGAEHRGARLTCALLTGGPRAISKVVGLVYADEETQPGFVVKWPRVEESEEGLAREADALAACHARAPV